MDIAFTLCVCLCLCLCVCDVRGMVFGARPFQDGGGSITKDELGALMSVRVFPVPYAAWRCSAACCALAMTSGPSCCGVLVFRVADAGYFR